MIIAETGEELGHRIAGVELNMVFNSTVLCDGGCSLSSDLFSGSGEKVLGEGELRKSSQSEGHEH
jgi:hypothetical protein